MKSITRLAAFPLFLLALGHTAPAAAEGDAEAGRTAFTRRCSACHAVQVGQNKIGPSLHAVVGREAGKIEGFNYSSAMRESGKIWDQATLDGYLANPRGVVPGTKMIMAGITSADERANIIAYLDAQR